MSEILSKDTEYRQLHFKTADVLKKIFNVLALYRLNSFITNSFVKQLEEYLLSIQCRIKFNNIIVFGDVNINSLEINDAIDRYQNRNI